jgi:6,7-dimethyl-8-ribityllumazine synthase
MKIGIVVSEYNYDITMMMLERAKDHASFLGVEVASVFRVPGTYDIPFGVSTLIRKGGLSAIVTLGAVIQGETNHDEVIMQNAARKIMDISIESGIPVTLGITGPGESRLQAEARIEVAKSAMESAVKLARESEKILSRQDKK